MMMFKDVQDFMPGESATTRQYRAIFLLLLRLRRRYESAPVQIELSMQIPEDHNEGGGAVNCQHHAAKSGRTVGNQALSNGEHVVVAHKAKHCHCQ